MLYRRPVYTRALLARDIAPLTVAFRTKRKGDELSRMLIQRILRLPNKCGLLFNFRWGQTLRSRADHILTMPYVQQQCSATCPLCAVEQFVAMGTASGWEMSKEYLFPTISPGKSGGLPSRASRPISAPEMTTALRAYAIAGGEHGILFVPGGVFHRRWQEKTYARLCSELFGSSRVRPGDICKSSHQQQVFPPWSKAFRKTSCSR